MSVVVNVALPVFATILAGFAAGRLGLMGQASSEALNRFVYWLALPPLLFLAMARAPVAEVLHVPFVGAFLGGVLAMWLLAGVIGAVVHRAPTEVMTMQGMTACFANTGYMGIPLFVAAFGEAGLAPASLATVILSALAVGLAVVGLELTGRNGGGTADAMSGAVLALSKNPLVVAPLAGLWWSFAEWPLPTPVVTLFDLLGAAAGPAALVAIGLFLARQAIVTDLAEIGWITALKLLWQPFVTWLLAVTVFPMDPFWTASAVILAALPTGALTFVIAQRYGVYVQRASSVILVSTIVSVVTLSALLAIYGPQFAPGSTVDDTPPRITMPLALAETTR